MSLERVVDASVAIKLFIPEDFSPSAQRLFGELKKDPPARLYVPDLFYLECANILGKHVRRFGYPAEDARQDMVALHALALELIETSGFLGSILDLALSQSITAYDASYVALARWLAIPLVSADERLIRKLAGSGVEVQWLGDL